MKLNTIGATVATRTLSLTTNGEQQQVTVIIGKPRPYENSRDYYCPYCIRGMGPERIRYASGIDGVQALMLTLKKIGAELYTSEQSRSGKLMWEGDENGDLGFPVPATLHDDFGKK